jgi:signal peptidase II
LKNKTISNSLYELVFIQNTGAAFSILKDYPEFLIIFSFFIILLIAIYVFKIIEKLSMFSLYWISILISGISCNLYERISLGYVQDFFKINFINFPVFNISDIFINIGVFALIILIIKNKAIINK